MPTAQSSNTNKKVDNKIASAAAKVAEQSSKSANQEATPAAAATNTGIKTPQEQPEFIKQSLILIEKKVRNLEKRKGKLEEYKEIQRKGTVLNEDQLAAVSRFDEVLRTLELARELEKQFIGLANDALKQQKKQAKKEQLEREEYVKEKVKEVQKIISVLNTFGDETVRNDFLAEANGATKISEHELNILDAFNKLVEPSELGAQIDTSSTEVADYLLNLVEGKNKQIAGLITEPAATTPITFNDLKKLFDRILSSTYWTKEQEQPAVVAEAAQNEQLEQQTQDAPEQQQPVVDDLNNLNLNDKQQNEQQATNVAIPTESTNQQAVFHQQNTSDSDYVMVNSNDFSNENTQAKLQQQHSPNQQLQQQQTKAYFTTLNPTSNINEFLQNNDEGINFLQDSQIQQAKQLHQQQQQQQQQQQHDNYDQQQTQEHQQFNNFNQDGSQNEAPKDHRGGNNRGPREYNGQRNYEQRPRNPNYEQRRSGEGGAPRTYQNRDNYQPRNNDNYQPRNNDNYQPRGDNYNSNGPRNGGGYRGGNRGGSSGGGGYRGGFNNSGPRTNAGTTNNNYQRGPRNQDSNHQPTVA